MVGLCTYDGILREPTVRLWNSRKEFKQWEKPNVLRASSPSSASGWGVRDGEAPLPWGPWAVQGFATPAWGWGISGGAAQLGGVGAHWDCAQLGWVCISRGLCCVTTCSVHVPCFVTLILHLRCAALHLSHCKCLLLLV